MQHAVLRCGASTTKRYCGPEIFHFGKTMSLNLAIVGTGIFATDKHLPTIANIKELTPSACYNRTKSKAETFAEKAGIKQENVFNSLEEVFESKLVDAVDALLPVQYNLDAVKLAVQHNKPICLEKPIAANLQQAREIVKLSSGSSTPIAILEQWSFLTVIKTLKEEILPKIGDIASFTYHSTGAWNDNNKYLATGWRQNPEHIGGFLSDGGVHQLALLTDVLGEVDTVSGFTKQLRKESGADDILYSTFKMKSGVIGNFTYGSAFGAADKTLRFTIMGTKGSVIYDFSPSLPKPTLSYQVGESSQRTTEKEVIEVDEIDNMKAEFVNFAEAVLSKEKSKIVVPPAKAFHHLAVIAAALESSSKNGTAVKVEEP